MESRWKQAETVQQYFARAKVPRPMAPEMSLIMLRVLSALERPVRRVLDVGCGGGQIGASVLAEFPEAVGVFADFSEPMLAGARETLRDVANEVHFVTADFAQPSWADAVAGLGPFDAIVSGFAFHHVPNDRKPSFAAELLGLLAPGGAFICQDWIDSPTPWLTDLHNRFVVEAYHAMGRYDDAGLSFEEALDQYAHRDDRKEGLLHEVTRLCGWLREAGFVDVDCYFKCFELAVFGGRRPAAGA